jgi:hypothetical protein
VRRIPLASDRGRHFPHRSLTPVARAAAAAPAPHTPSAQEEIRALQSAAARGFTVVTIVTLIFTPVWKGHHWVDVLTGKTTETTVVKCQPNEPCPAQKHITKKVVLPHP